jgi:hypothetical protein
MNKINFKKEKIQTRMHTLCQHHRYCIVCLDNFILGTCIGRHKRLDLMWKASLHKEYQVLYLNPNKWPMSILLVHLKYAHWLLSTEYYTKPQFHCLVWYICSQPVFQDGKQLKMSSTIYCKDHWPRQIFSYPQVDGNHKIRYQHRPSNAEQ